MGLQVRITGELRKGEDRRVSLLAQRVNVLILFYFAEDQRRNGDKKGGNMFRTSQEKRLFSPALFANKQVGLQDYSNCNQSVCFLKIS